MAKLIELAKNPKVWALVAVALAVIGAVVGVDVKGMVCGG